MPQQNLHSVWLHLVTFTMASSEGAEKLKARKKYLLPPVLMLFCRTHLVSAAESLALLPEAFSAEVNKSAVWVKVLWFHFFSFFLSTPLEFLLFFFFFLSSEKRKYMTMTSEVVSFCGLFVWVNILVHWSRQEAVGWFCWDRGTLAEPLSTVLISAPTLGRTAKRRAATFKLDQNLSFTTLKRMLLFHKALICDWCKHRMRQGQFVECNTQLVATSSGKEHFDIPFECTVWVRAPLSLCYLWPSTTALHPSAELWVFPLCWREDLLDPEKNKKCYA